MVSAMPSLEGFMAFSPGNVPNTILLMLPDNRLQVQSQNGTTESDAEWEGINEQSGTKVCSISIASESPIYKAIGEKDVYRLSFSKPEDSVDNPWIVMDCRKQGESSEEARITVVGEILQVWIK